MNLNQVLPKSSSPYPETTETSITYCKKSASPAVLNLQTDEDMKRLECDWRKLHTHYRRSTIVVRRVPVRDFDAEELRKMLPDCVRALNELLRKGHTVYVHCTSGIGRSPSVVITYLNWIQQYELEKAAQVVQKCRPCSPNLEAIRMASQDLLGDAA